MAWIVFQISSQYLLVKPASYDWLYWLMYVVSAAFQLVEIIPVTELAVAMTSGISDLTGSRKCWPIKLPYICFRGIGVSQAPVFRSDCNPEA